MPKELLDVLFVVAWAAMPVWGKESLLSVAVLGACSTLTINAVTTRTTATAVYELFVMNWKMQ